MATCDPAQIPKRLTGVPLLSMPDLKPISCETLWADRPVLLCMFRRWGCGICRMSAANISSAAPILAKKQVRLVGVGIEQLGFQEFYDGGYFSGELFVDEEKKAYKALELRQNSWRNLWGLLDGEITKLFNQSQAKGYENNLRGNITQLGGTFLIMPDGTVPYAHFQSKDSFEPDLYKIMEVLQLVPPSDYELYPSYAKVCNKRDCK